MLSATGDYVLQFTDSETGAALSGVKVSGTGQTYQSGADGRVQLNSANLATNRKLTMELDGYQTQTTSLADLSKIIVNRIPLTPSSVADPLGFQQQLGNIQLGSAPIKGPTADLFGYEVALFSFDLGLNLDLAKFNFKTSYDEKNQTYKVLLGVKPSLSLGNRTAFLGEYEKFKDFFMISNTQKDDICRDYFNNLKYDLEALPCDLGISASVSVAGFITFDVSGGKLDVSKVIESGITVTASASASFDFPIWYIFYATFSLGSEGGFTLKYTMSNTGSFVDHLSAEIFFNLTASAGVGAKIISKKIASLELGLNGKIGPKFKIPAKNLKECMTVTANLSGYIKANLWKLSGSIPINLVDVSLYPTLGVTFLDDPKLKKAPARSTAGYTLGVDDLTIMPRDYLEARTPAARRAKALSPQVSDTFTETAAYPYGYPNLIRFGNTLMAVWVDDDGGKADADANTLYYAVYNGSSWSAAAPVYENGTADFEAELATDGNTVYAVWQRATTTFGNTAELEDYAENTELVYAEYRNGSWSTPVAVRGAQNLVTDYAVYADDDTATIAWIENDAFDCFGETGVNSVYTVNYANGAWAEPNLIAAETDLPDINSLAVGALDGEIAVGYCGAQSFFLNGETFVEGDEGSTAYACKYQNDAFWFVSAEGLTRCDGLSADSVVDVSKQDYKVLSNGTKTAILYTAEDGFSNEIYVIYEDEEGGFTDPVALTNFGKHISSYDAVMNADGTITVAADVENLAEEGAEYPYTTTDFIITQIGDYVSIRTEESILYDASAIQPGETVVFKTNVQNLGTADVDTFDVQLLDDADQILTQAKIRKTVASGENGELELSYRLPATLTRTKLKMVVSANGDIDTSDNIAEAEFGFADLVLENYAITDNGVIIARVVNQGYEAAEDVTVDISKYDEGETKLATLEIGTLAPSERKSITYTVADDKIEFSEEKQRNLFLLKAEAAADDGFPVQASAEVSLYPTAVESVSLNKESLTLPVGGAYTLFAAVSPLTAFDKSILWLTTDSSVVTVDDNGTVTATGLGEATITAVTSNSDVVANCAVTVQDTVDQIAVTGLTLDRSELQMTEGAQVDVKATVAPQNATNPEVIWTSDNEDVAVVSQSGKVIALAQGETMIRAKAADGGFEKTIALTVTAAVYSIQWIVDGEVKTQAYEVGAPILPPDNPQIPGYYFTGWTPTVPDVMPANDLTFVAVFKLARVESVAVTPETLTLETGESGQLAATVLPEEAANKAVVWSSDNTNAATVDSTGNVIAVGAGFATITATTVDGGFTATCAVTVNAKPQYTLTFDSKGGSEVPPITAEVGTPISAPENPTRTGYTFVGWTDANGVDASIPATMLSQNATYMAKWEANQYNVTWVVDEVRTEQKLTFGAAITKPNDPTKDGYTFTGWTPAVPETMPANDLTFTAVFEKVVIPSTIKIQNYTATKSVDYKTTITFTVIVTDAPKGATIQWFVNDKKAETGETCTVKQATADYTVQVKLVGSDGSVLAESEIETVKVNTGFFAKLVAFFKGLFGSLPIITQAIKETL